MFRHAMIALAVFAVSFIAGNATAFAQSDEDALGIWRHPDNGSHIQIYKCGPSMCAKVVKVQDPSRKDIHNPNPALRNRPIVGIIIMHGGKKIGPGKWSGRLYNTLDGQTYNGTLSILNHNQLKLEGCVLGGLICDSRIWTRV